MVAMAPLSVSYRARPFVCGAIGSWERARLDRLKAASPSRIRAIYTADEATLWSSTAVPTWRATTGHGWLWSPLAHGPAPQSWQDAAELRVAAGLVVEGRTATLHTCNLGLQELYTRRVGGALYYATRIAPLLAICDTYLHTDWSAWASVLAVGAPVGDATPFQEVRRMVAGTAWRASGQSIRRITFEPTWLAAEPNEPVDVAGLIRALSEQIPLMSRWRRTAVTLSGGWDSRLLGALAVQRSRRAPLAWTTSPDDGHDQDVALSKPVAQALGMTHRVLVPDLDAWRSERAVVFDRVQHQTWLHTWLMPLARQIHHHREPLLDGLAGDVLLKSLFVDEEVLAPASPAGRRDVLWTRLSGGRLHIRDWFAPGVAARLEEASRAAFAGVVKGLDGRPAASTLSVLLTRTARVIAASPLCLFAPEVDVRLPFVHPSVIGAALRVPIPTKIGGGYYRELLLAAAGPAVAGLPSTNDPGPRPRTGPRRQTEPAALAAMAAEIAADEIVRALLGPQLLPALTDPQARAKICSYNGPRATLQWASMFAHWRATYGSRLAPESAIAAAT
jgi:hypothetical protein